MIDFAYHTEDNL